MIFDGMWLYDDQEEAKEACAAGCIAANENNNMWPDMYPLRCAYAELAFAYNPMYLL